MAARRYVPNPLRLYLDLAEPPAASLPSPNRRIIENFRKYAEDPTRFPLLFEALKLRYRGRTKTRSYYEVEYRRREGLEFDARLGQWLGAHVDTKSRYLTHGRGGGSWSLEQIARELRRPGEQAVPISTLCRALSRFVADELIYRHTAKDLIEGADNVRYWRSHVATTQLTRKFWHATRTWGLRLELLKWLEKREAKDDLRRRLAGDAGAVARALALQKSQDKMEHHRRQVRAEHPTWTDWEIEREARGRLKDEKRREALARRKPPPGN